MRWEVNQTVDINRKITNEVADKIIDTLTKYDRFDENYKRFTGRQFIDPFYYNSGNMMVRCLIFYLSDLYKEAELNFEIILQEIIKICESIECRQISSDLACKKMKSISHFKSITEYTSDNSLKNTFEFILTIVHLSLSSAIIFKKIDFKSKVIS
jgi:hypothetical protein